MRKLRKLLTHTTWIMILIYACSIVVPKDCYIKVIYAPNEYQEGLKSSLAEGNIKISDLDKFNIEYIKKEITN